MLRVVGGLFNSGRSYIVQNQRDNAISRIQVKSGWPCYHLQKVLVSWLQLKFYSYDGLVLHLINCFHI